MARRIALDLPERSVVNLGIGLPTLVSNWLTPERSVLLHSENGVIGLGPAATANVDPDLIDAGKTPATLVPGAAIVDHATSFALIHGGRLDIAVLGALQVSETGDLANWQVAGARLGSVGGAMDIAVGARQVFVMMRHTDKGGQPKIVRRCSYPLTASGCVSRIYTELAVIDVSPAGLVVKALAPGVERSSLRALTEPELTFTDDAMGSAR
jgi:3-oxoadipate CoA-transferase beta subunit